MSDIKEDLKNKIKGEVLEDEKTLEAHSRDASLFYVKPQTVIFPKDKEDVINIIKYVGEKKKSGVNISITGRSAGTDIGGGPLTESVVMVFTKHMNHMLEVNKDFAIAEPGMFYRDFEKETLKYNWLMPSYPASRELCALGGIISNNSGGEKTLTYGKTEKYIKEIDVVFANGETDTIKPLNKQELEAKMLENTESGRIHKEIFDLINKNEEIINKNKPTVTKNSSGYYIWNVYDKEKEIFDLNKLVVGSQGTLGMVTSAKITGVAPKKHSRMLVIFLKSFHELGDIVPALLKHKPETIESYDEHTFKIAMKFLPDIAKKMGGSMITLGFKFLPEIFAVLTGGVPKLILMAEWTGDDEEELKKIVQVAHDDMHRFPFEKEMIEDEHEAKKYWTFRRESFNLLRSKLKGFRTAPTVEDLCVHVKDLPEYLPKLQAIFDRYNFIYTIAGHVGDANFHVYPLIDIEQKDVIKDLYKMMEEAYDLTFEYKGSMSGEHNDGILRTPYLGRMFGSEMENIFKEIKNIFDPQNILNPGKKVDGTLEYAFAHIDKKK